MRARRHSPSNFLHFVFSACLMIPWILTIRVGWTGGCLEDHARGPNAS
jgi:hypothetical protein